LRDQNIKIIKTAANKLNLPQLLAKCNNIQLVEVILEHAKEDKNFANYLCMKLSENSDINSIISDFNRISDRYFKGRSDIEDVLKAGELLIDKTEKLCSSVEKVQVYTEIITMLEEDIENSRFSSISCWHYLLHDIYKLSENTKKFIDICYGLLKDSKTDYYEEWKSLIPEESRSDEIYRLLNESENYSYEYIVSL